MGLTYNSEHQRQLLSVADSFGIPPIRLVRGSSLLELGRFPRSNEREHIVTVTPETYADLKVKNVRDACIFFVSRPATSLRLTSTSDHWHETAALLQDQCGALMDYLDQCPSGVNWDEMYFWVECSSLDQDNAELRSRQTQALPVYMSCCKWFVGLCWGDYWQRAWCRVEAAGFRADQIRHLITPTPCGMAYKGQGLGQLQREVLGLGDGAPPEGGRCKEEEDRRAVDKLARSFRLIAAIKPPTKGEVASVLKMQTMARGRLARTAPARKKATDAAARIQSVARGKFSRNAPNRAAAVRIQAVHRGRAERARKKDQLQASIKIQTAARGKIIRRVPRHAAATEIQTMCRGKIARRRGLPTFASWAAATFIQTVIRGKQARAAARAQTAARAAAAAALASCRRRLLWLQPPPPPARRQPVPEPEPEPVPPAQGLRVVVVTPPSSPAEVRSLRLPKAPDCSVVRTSVCRKIFSCSVYLGLTLVASPLTLGDLTHWAIGFPVYEIRTLYCCSVTRQGLLWAHVA